MHAFILLFFTALIVTPLNLNYIQNIGVSPSEDSDTVTLVRCRLRRCRQYRGSGRRMALNGNIAKKTLV
ncbi:hypothetical protein RINTHH_22690 [Richelia intracellularis HH01]|jgi:hypothetical protein|uniref:Uncharacterized protein n=1 Tax=Richelia intracellularis HH01 TaxID=1165094 RepID=M1WTV7_9NOST|nr:hypothetical protein RINTHH_22690 [Richelia intracellularis HH01]